MVDRILLLERRNNKTIVGYSVALLLLFASYLLTLYNNKRLFNDQVKITHTNEVINNLESLLSSVKDAETGVRGFFITSDSIFLYPYTNGLIKIDTFYIALKQLITDNPTQLKKLDTLNINIKERLRLLTFSLINFMQNNYQLNDSIRKDMFENKTSMDAIRLQTKNMEITEDILLKGRIEASKKTNNLIDIYSFISLLLALGLVVLGFITYRIEHKERKNAYTEIINYQTKLSNQVIELATANKQLIQMRSQEKFAATGRIARQIAHEVRNPLTNINLAANQLKEDLNVVDEENLYLFDMIDRNSDRINQLITELLNSTKFAELNFTKENINEVMDNALQLADDRIILHKINVTKQYHALLPDFAIDKQKITISFLNLIVNAIEAMEQKTYGTLFITTEYVNNKIKITVADNGKGMDEEALSKIFEPYFTNKPNGNGLGLTNIQNVILNHKGEISVKSELGEGTSFTIVL